MKIKKEKLNIVVPMAKIDDEFIKEFGKFKYLTHIGKNKIILNYNKKIFEDLKINLI